MRSRIIVALTLSILGLVSCKTAEAGADTFPSADDEVKVSYQNSSYRWMLGKRALYTPLSNRFEPPTGFSREIDEPGSFASWLEGLPLKDKGAPVLLFNGKEHPDKDRHAAVIKVDIGGVDLQQCADAVIRLHAEYLFMDGRKGMIKYELTSGDELSWNNWRDGQRIKVNGNDVDFYNIGETNIGYNVFKKYLFTVFTYAGSYSLNRELEKAEGPVRAGDIFIQGGFPGHAIIVLETAVNEAGKRLMLLAQSYMPAQSIHILNNHDNAKLSPWYEADFEGELITPDWSFKRSDRKRFSFE